MNTKRALILSLITLVSLMTFARPQKRSVVIDTVCNASIEEMIQVTNRFCRQFQASPDSLFEWAYQGLAEDKSEQQKTKESRDAIQLRYKDRVYDPVNKTGDVAIDIYVLGVRWWKDQHLGTRHFLIMPEDSSAPLKSQMVATYSGSILEGADCLFLMKPTADGKTHIHYEFNFTFGRVLSAFISDKTWQNAIEWRFGVILENIIEYAETGTVQPKPLRGPKK